MNDLALELLRKLSADEFGEHALIVAEVPQTGFGRIRAALVHHFGATNAASELCSALEKQWESSPQFELPAMMWAANMGSHVKAGKTPQPTPLDRRLSDLLSRSTARTERAACYSTELASFLERGVVLEQHGLTDAALDLIYDSLDELLRRGQFAMIDSVLCGLDVGQYSADVLLALLTATAPARSDLSSRKDFFRRVKATLRLRGEYERGPLRGLG